ncbi:toll-like receptor 4 [Haliotis rubra]|uniref:toll-like receptor 4 n=1 Tax=Haliotis rubra TaxID=36100 RepID=UPI001EE51EEE|nr:toll-like receptor 4 [Haliotis rubra]
MTLLLLISDLATSEDRGSTGCEPCHCYTSEGVIEADCSERNLHEIPTQLPPNITDLNLSGNKIVRLKTGYLNYTELLTLNVSSNRIRSIELDTFKNLTNLVALDLHGNKLPPTKKSYQDGVFRYQKKLKKLYIHNNVESRSYAGSLSRGFSSSYPDGAFKDLLALEELIIDGMREIYFGTGFQFLEQLKNLSLGGGDGGTCQTRNLRNKTFENLHNLKTLDISHCLLLNIELSSFEKLKNLHSLDLSFNMYLGLSKAGEAMYGLQNSSLKILDVSKLSRTLGPSITLQTHHMKYLRNIEIEELNITGNRIELIDRNAILYLPRSLKEICIRDNHMGFGLYMLELSILTNLKWFDASHQGTSSLSFDNEKLNSRYRRHSGKNTQPLKWSITLTIPPNITYADFSYCKMTYDIKRFHFSRNRLRELNLSHNFFSKWIGPIWGLKHLEIVDLSHNFCDFIGKEFGKHFPSMKTLNLGYNYLGYALQDGASTILDDFPLLENLDMSNNKVRVFPKTILNNLTLIKSVNLSSNYLMAWNSDIVNFNMKTLDLSRNLFAEIPSLLRYQVAAMHMKDFRLYFEENPLRCSCATLTSLIWMTEHASRIHNYAGMHCVDDGNRKILMKNIHQVILGLRKRCASYVGLTLGIMCLMMLVLCLGIAGIVYRFRWKLRYLFYLARMKHSGYVAAAEEEDGTPFEFDAFISYADEDRRFVIEDVRQILEGRHGLRLCIHHRDFLVGEAIAANILNAVKSSRKTVIVLSRHFLKSYWCKYEVEMAKMESIYSGRNTLLVVVLESIPVKDLPPDIVQLMREDSYVEYTNVREGREVFWQNIERAIRAVS